MLRHNTACPFCGLCCDDLTIKSEPEQITVEANGCPLSERVSNLPGVSMVLNAITECL